MAIFNSFLYVYQRVTKRTGNFGDLKPIEGGRVSVEISSAQDHDFDDFLARQAGV
jgi:hypothetical protein